MSALSPALVWDLDGTLIDSAPDICRALNSILADAGHARLGDDAIRGMIGDGVARLVERGFSAAGARLDDAALKRSVERFLTRYSADPAGLTVPFPGAEDTLAELARAGVRHGICTNKPEALSRSVLRELGMDRYFDAIVGGDTRPAMKPDPEPLRACIEALGATTATTTMIGDSAIDVAAARAVGIPVGIVSFGYARASANGMGADFVIGDLAELPEVLEKRYRDQAVAC